MRKEALTVFGKILRKLRLDFNELLKDMAGKLGITSSYLSLIELGKRDIPDNFVKKLVCAYGLNADQACELEQARILYLKKVSLNVAGASLSKKEFALMFASKFDELDERQLKCIQDFVNELLDGSK
jgi:transcriptional regulator with XRE-family HTH domain